MTETKQFRLGLIGSNILESRAPDLHKFAGKLAGLSVSYDLFIPHSADLSFTEMFERCRADGIDALNITHPYKEQVVGLVQTDETVTRIGAVNTVLFRPDGAVGFNTDFTGFVAAFKNGFPNRKPGNVVIFGAGGVGRAVAFGLHELAADTVILVDPDQEKAEILASQVVAAGTKCRVGTSADLHGANGVVNCTALGMTGNMDCAVPAGMFPKNAWAFDAVYTPIDTPFKAQALAANADFMSGFELFFHQGLHAFELFTGRPVAAPEQLRQRLLQ